MKDSKENKFVISLPEILEELGIDVGSGGLPPYERLAEYETIAKRELTLWEVNDATVGFIKDHIMKWNKQDQFLPIEKRKPIKIYIDSDGGMLVSVMNLINLIQMSRTPVWTIGMSRCYSAGGLALMSGHRRIVYPHTTFLMHDGTIGFFGSTSKVKDAADFANRFEEEKIKTWVLANTKISTEDYDKCYRKEWYMTAEEIVKYGIADEIAKELI